MPHSNKCQPRSWATNALSLSLSLSLSLFSLFTPYQLAHQHPNCRPDHTPNTLGRNTCSAQAAAYVESEAGGSNQAIISSSMQVSKSPEEREAQDHQQGAAPWPHNNYLICVHHKNQEEDCSVSLHQFSHSHTH